LTVGSPYPRSDWLWRLPLNWRTRNRQPPKPATALVVVK